MGELLARLGSHYLITKASRILGYKAVQEIIKDLANEHDQLATQVSQTLSPVQLLNVLRNLLDDGVPLLLLQLRRRKQINSWLRNRTRNGSSNR